MTTMLISLQTLIIIGLAVTVVYLRHTCNTLRTSCDQQSPDEFYEGTGRHRGVFRYWNDHPTDKVVTVA